MSELKSLKKLRGYASECCPEYEPYDSRMMRIAEEIQAEVDSRFIELPVDKHGVPIRVGDLIAEDPYRPNLGEKPREVVCMLFNSDGWCVSNRDPVGHWWNPQAMIRIKPRTLEDVLKELACDVRREWVENAPLAEHVYSEYADEIRELMEVDDAS